MDSRITWLRHHIARTIARRLARTALGTTVVAAATALLLVDGFGLGTATVLGASVGLGAAVLRLVASFSMNPLDLKFLRTYVSESVRFAPSDRSPLPPATGVDGVAPHGYVLTDETADETVYGVLAAGPIIIVRSRPVDDVVYFSRLLDGRVVFTDKQLTVPRPGFIQQLVRDGDAKARLGRHNELLARLAADGLLVDPSPNPELVLEHLDAEREGFRRLGPAWGCFLAVDGPGPRWQLTVDVDPVDLLALEEIRPMPGDRPERVLRLEPSAAATRSMAPAAVPG